VSSATATHVLWLCLVCNRVDNIAVLAHVEQCQALQVVAAWHPEDSDGVHQPPIREVHADGLMLIREDPTLDEEKERHSSGPAIPLPIGGADSKEDTKTEEAQE
jgi:hypothetical protein